MWHPPCPMVHGPFSTTPLSTQSRHKEPKILGGIFQSFDDGQNKILFRALIRKYKRPVGWHKMPWPGQAGGSTPTLPLPLPQKPRQIAAKPDLARKVLLAEKLWWETAPSLVNCNANLWLVTNAWRPEPVGLGVREVVLVLVVELEGVVHLGWSLGRLSRCKILLTICTCWPGCCAL